MKIRILSFFLVVAFTIGIFPFIAISKASAEDTSLILWYKFNSTSNEELIEDSSGHSNNGTLKGSGATIEDGALNLSDSSYVELPKGMFDGQNSLTISMWLKNDTGKGNYSAMFFGTTESYPSQYWLFNPCNPSGLFKSVITNSVNSSAPWNTEYGISPTKSSQGIAGPSTDASWAFYTTVIEPNSITAYYNGIKVGTVATSRTVSQFGTGLVSYIGKSSYSDPYFKGAVRDVKVYTSALTEEQINEINAKTILEKDKNELNIENTRVVSNLSLPLIGTNGSEITWKSSNSEYITDDGIVTRPKNGAGDASIVMTATLSKNGMQVTKDFNIEVLENSQEKDLEYLNNIVANFELGITYVTEDLYLPNIVKGGVSVSWKSDKEEIISSTGKVTRPDSTEQNVILTADLEFGQAKVSKSFEVKVAEKSYGYLLTYLVSGDTDRTDCLHIAYSKEGKDFTALHDNKGICYMSKGSNKMGYPSIFRKADGTYGLITSDDNKSSYIIIMDSDDLLSYKNERYLQINNKGINVINPSCYFDVGVDGYRINFQGSDGNSYTTTTTDFTTFTEIETCNYSKENVTGNLPEGAIEASTFEVTQSEYERVVEKYSRVSNIGIKLVEKVDVQAGNAITLPEKVTAEYSDGSTKSMGVLWNQDELNSIDTTKPGVYTIKGTVQQKIYPNPLIEERADPYVVLGDDGYYYFTASYPTHGDKDTEGYDRIILRRAKTIEELQNAPEITLWSIAKSSKCFRYIWAPEMHYINGKWYIFYTASRSSNVWDIRPHILECDGDPYNSDNWVEKGQVKPVSGDSFSFSTFSLDMTYFSCNGKHYVAWAQTSPSSIYLATIDPDKPWQLTSKAICLTAPEYAWEWKDGTIVDEGPAIIKNDGKIFLCFSASAVDSSYCIGMISADETDNLLDISSWTKNAYPLLTSDDFNGEYGPGHNSFTVDEYGNPVIVYHSRPEECNNNTCEYASSSDLNDPHRHARVKNVNFAADGSPILNMTYEEELKDENKNVTVMVNIIGSAEISNQVTGVAITGETVVGNALSAQLTDENGNAVTTSQAVTYKWYSSNDTNFEEDELVGEEKSYNLSISDLGKYVKLQVTVNGNTFESITQEVIEKILDKIPTGVLISGTKQVYNKLTAEFIDENRNEVTTDTFKVMTYKWYRSSNTDFKELELIGESNSYNLVNKDSGKYIKLIVMYGDKTFEVTTSRIKPQNSTSNRKSKSADESVVNVTDGNSNNCISKASIERTTKDDGTIKETVNYTESEAQDTIKHLLKEGKDIGRIVILDEKDEISETTFYIPNSAVLKYSEGDADLEMDTADGRIILPRESIKDISKKEKPGSDLYFKLEPLKDISKQKEIETEINKEQIIKQAAGSSSVKIFGRTIKIDTNLQGSEMNIIVPLKATDIPTNNEERDRYLESVGIYIEYSNGEKAFEKGTIVEYSKDKLGIKLTVNKLGNFTIVKLNKEQAESDRWKNTEKGWEYIKDETPVTGWNNINGYWYLMNSTGIMQTGWQEINNTWYLLKDDGEMAVGWQEVNDKWYYLYDDGSMAYNTTIEGYIIDKNGECI